MAPLLQSITPYQGEIYSILCALLWAVAVILFRKSGSEVPPVALNLFKNVVALVLLLPTIVLLERPLLPADASLPQWAALLASGVIGIGIADSLFFASLNRLGAGRSAIVDCLYSPMVIGSAWLVLAEPIGPWLLLGVVLMIGAILLGTYEPDPDELLEPRARRVGVLYGIAAMATMAVGIVLAKPVLAETDLLWATAVRLVGGATFLAVQGLLNPRHRASLGRIFRPSRLWQVALPASVVGTYLAMVVWLAGMKHTHASVASALNQTSALFIVLLAVPLLNERLTRRRLAGVLLGFGGAIVVVLWGRG